MRGQSPGKPDLNLEKIWRIKFSLINSVNLFSKDDYVELVPIIDRFLLLLQINIGVEVVLREKKKEVIEELVLRESEKKEKQRQSARPVKKKKKPTEEEEASEKLLKESIKKENIRMELMKEKYWNKYVFSFAKRLGKQTILDQWEKNKVDHFAEDFVINKNVYGFYAYKIDSNDENIYKLDRAEWKAVSDLIRLINSDSEKHSEFLRKQLDRAFAGALTKKSGIVKNDTNDFMLTQSILETEISKHCKKSIREVLDDAFGSFSRNPLIYNKKYKIATFFSVIRYPFNRGKLKYTAQILLSGQQKKAIENELADSSSEFLTNFSIPSFEDPLDGTSTSLADRCFSVDTVQFGLPYDSKNQNEKTQSDTIRRTLEDDFYKRLLDDKVPTNVFYVPIHVNGAAWIAIYRVLHRENQLDNWFLNFEMYNQYTLLIAEKIRLKAKEKFFRLLFSFIEKAATNSKETEQFMKESESLMNILSAFYPYPAPYFKRSGIETSVDDYLLHIGQKDFSSRLNVLWDGAIEHDKLELEELNEQVITFCKQVGRAIRNQKIEEELRDASYSISHLLKNKLDEPIEQVNEIVFNLNRLVEDKVIQIDKSEFMENFKEFNILSDDLRDTLTILDLIPKSSVEISESPNYQAFLNDKAKFLMPENAGLDLIPVISDALSRKRIKEDIRLARCEIEPYIQDSEGAKYSPSKLIYHNCFIEAILNYKVIAHYGNLIITKCVDWDGTLGVCFKNITSDSDDLNSEFLEVNHQFGFHGAIGYLNAVSKKVGIGIIKKRVIKENDKKYFELGLFFDNLKIEV